MKGIIKAVNKNGIKIEENWYNATKECEAQIKPELKGTSVEIELIPESKLFKSIKKIEMIKEENNQSDMKYRAMAISYSKDLVVAESITPADMITIADGIFYYIKTGDKKC
jgi:hypothetical protein